MEAWSVVSRRKWVKIGLIIVCLILFAPQNCWNPSYWNRSVAQVGQWEHLRFDKVNYVYDEDSWIFTLELKSKGNIPVYIHEVNYTFYEGQTPVKYETCVDAHGNILLKDLPNTPIMVPDNEKIIVEGDVCKLVGCIFSDADVRTAEGSVDRYLVLSRNVNSGEIRVNNLTYIDCNGAVYHWEYLESGPIIIPPSMRCVIEFRVPDAESGDTVKILLRSAGMHYTENIQLPINH